MGSSWGCVLAVTGFVACPCHLPLTLPILVRIPGGTGVGGFVAANLGLAYGVFTAYFVGGIGAGVLLMNRRFQVPRQFPKRDSACVRLALTGRLGVRWD